MKFITIVTSSNARRLIGPSRRRGLEQHLSVMGQVGHAATVTHDDDDGDNDNDVYLYWFEQELQNFCCFQICLKRAGNPNRIFYI